MNIFDKVIGAVFPGRGAARARARMQIRLYDGASHGRRGSAWRARGSSANLEIGPALTSLRDRARELVRNSPHARRGIDVLVAHTVGAGIRPVVNTGNDKLNKKVMSLWNAWNAKADVTRVLSFDAMQRLAVRSMIESGEVVCRFLDQKMNGDGTVVPLRLQLLESDFIDQNRDGPADRDAPRVKRSRLGVGLGENDERLGYWLYPEHPGDMRIANYKPSQSAFHDADSLIHLFYQERPGQVRGVPWLASVLTTSRDLSDFLDAVTVKARIEACFAGFITNNDETEPLMETTPARDPNNPDATMSTLEPGMLKELKQGQDIKFAQPTGATQVDTMLMFNLQAIAAGIGCTYDQISGDLRQANYSSLRAGKLEFKALVEQVQKLTVVPMLCAPVWDRFISRAIISGMLKERKEGYPVTWVPPAWEAINPKIDYDAELHTLRSGRMSPQQYIAGYGNDYKEVLDQWKEFVDECAKRDLVFDSLPNKTTRTGAAQQTAEGGAGQGEATDGDGNAIGGSSYDQSSDSSSRLFVEFEDFLLKKNSSAKVVRLRPQRR